MEEYVFNIGPILFWLSILAIIILLGVIAFLVHSFKGLDLFSKHDNSIIDKFLSKYPNVTQAFIQKDVKAQNIENNQEIHNINVRLDEQDNRIEKIEDNIAKILDMLERLQNKDL